MYRLPPLDLAQATGPSKDLLERTQAQLGRVPNLYRTMAHAPAALEGYLQFRASLVKGLLDARLREQLALAVAEANDCGYCVAAHMFRGGKLAIPQEELAANRLGGARDPRTAAALSFAVSVTRKHGQVEDAELEAVRAAGWSDGEVVEIVAHVALNIFSNLFSHVARPELDFPEVEAAHA